METSGQELRFRARIAPNRPFSPGSAISRPLMRSICITSAIRLSRKAQLSAWPSDSSPIQNSTVAESTPDSIARLVYQLPSVELSPSARQIVSALSHISFAPVAALCGSAKAEAARRTSSGSTSSSRNRTEAATFSR